MSRTEDAATSSRDLLREAFRTLKYNQELVQFADSKAGTLILINSLFVAATQAASPSDPLLKGLQASYVVAAAVAVVACLRVVMARSPRSVPRKEGRKDLVFFEDIRSRRTAHAYTQEFEQATAGRLTEDLLARAFAVAGIAQRKFRSYGVAQSATALSGTLWLVAQIVNVLA